MPSTLKNSTENSRIKFIYSYGGKIVPRSTDGKLRYVGGLTRILTVDRSITYAELAVKFWESCGGSSMKLRCQLPNEDLDVLVSVTCDEDLAHVIDVYERTNQKDILKIRAVLDPIKSLKAISPPLSPLKFSASKPPKSPVPKASQLAAKTCSPRPVAAPVAAAYRRCSSAGPNYTYSCHNERVR